MSKRTSPFQFRYRWLLFPFFLLGWLLLVLTTIMLGWLIGDCGQWKWVDRWVNWFLGVKEKTQ